MKLYSREHSVSNLVSRLFSFFQDGGDRRSLGPLQASHFKFVESNATEENLLFPLPCIRLCLHNTGLQESMWIANRADPKRYLV